MEKNSIRILFFRIYAEFEADDGIDNSEAGNKINSIFKQNPACNGCYIVSELIAVLKIR